MNPLPRMRLPSLAAAVSLVAALAAGCGSMNTTSGSGALNTPDAAFAVTAAGSGMYEVTVSRLAVTRAVDPRVKAYAQMLVDHHSMSNRELMSLLSAKGGMAPPSAIPPDKQAKASQLSSRAGADFDREYIRMVGIEDHTTDIALFERESRAGNDPDLRAWAAKTLPVLQAHLSEAQSLSGMLR
jgi:putative membrane protein